MTLLFLIGSASSLWAQASSCAECHAEIFRQQQASHHAQSLRKPEKIPELTSVLPFRMEDRASQAALAISIGSNGRIELAAGGSARLDWLWAFGSGAKGITPVGRAADGSLVESRLSWYASSRGFGLTTGSTRRQPGSAAESLGRSLTISEVKECFGCHTTGYTPDLPEPGADQMGIRCERCHGSGAEHARAPAKGNIRHPGRMEAFAQVQLCGECHGRPPADTDVRALAALERDPNSVRFPSQRLMLSRCFNETPGGLACTGCHDPHIDVPAQLDAPCLRCHAVGARKGCPKGSKDCASCHMPRLSVMMHSRFSDHWIRR